jgi:hypothetical protein
MYIFVTKKVESINAREAVYEICASEDSILWLFESKLKGTTYISEFKTILKYIEYAANGGRLPGTKMKLLKRSKRDNIAEIEFKTKHLRIYAIQLPNMKIILLCGFKNSQKEDIKYFRSLKNQFLESINLKYFL